MPEWLPILKLPPEILYLVGVVVLFLRWEAQWKASEAKHEALIERYHGIVTEQVRTLTILSEQLEDRNDRP